MSADKTRRLPSGGTTTDVDEYVSAWQALAEPLCKEFGWTLHAFDPGFMFDTEAGVLPLPTLVVERLGETLSERDGFALELADERENVETLKLHVETIREASQLASKEVMRLRAALERIGRQYHWDDSPAGSMAREALGKAGES